MNLPQQHHSTQTQNTGPNKKNDRQVGKNNRIKTTSDLGKRFSSQDLPTTCLGLLAGCSNDPARSWCKASTSGRVVAPGHSNLQFPGTSGSFGQSGHGPASTPHLFILKMQKNGGHMRALTRLIIRHTCS